jgi:hypothetical protein
MEVIGSESVVTTEQPTATPEQPVQVEQTEKPKEMLSTQFAALAKKEKAALQRQREAESKLKEAEEKLKLYEQFETKKKSAKANPLEFISEAGLTYDDITEFMLNGGARHRDKTEVLEEKFNEFVKSKEKEEQDRIEKEKQSLKAQEEKVIAQFKQSVNKYITDNQDKFELINLYSAQELVIATIEQHFEDKQEILSNERAAELVEAHLEEEAKKLANSKKFSQTFKDSSDNKQQGASKNSVTLSSSHPTSNVPSMLSAKTEEERLRRALAALG